MTMGKETGGGTLRAGVIGCGGRGHAHAEGYAEDERVTIAACADPSEEARTALAGRFGVERTWADYGEMLDRERLDLVSVCTWPHLHRPMIEAAAAAGARAIHAEKPMAPTWGDARALHAACEEGGVLLTFCHQRRFGDGFATARDLIRDGAIGPLRRFEGVCANLFDWGTHWFDMMFFYNDETPARWVMGQIDVSEHREIFGVRLDTSGLSWVRFENEVEGLLTTGDAGHAGPANRLIGDEGVIEVQGGGGGLRMRRGGGWEEVERTSGVPAPRHTIASVRDLVDCLHSGEEPELSSRKALQATELIFATYESSRRRGRVDLPLQVEDSALLSMLDEGVIGGG